MRRLLTLLAILGAAAPIALFALQDDDGAPATTHAAHTAGEGPPAALPPGPSSSRAGRASSRSRLRYDRDCPCV